MSGRTLSMRRFTAPFRQAFTHASARRERAESLIAFAQDLDGRRGFGEGCPRDYVTGEDLASSAKFCEAAGPSLAALESAAALPDWLEEHRVLIDAHPAACCALELAHLDYFGKLTGRSVEQLVGAPEVRGGLEFSAVLGAGSFAAFTEQAERYLKLGFGDFKLKTMGDPAEDSRRAAFLQARLAEPLAFRIDANNLWRDPEEALRYLAALNPAPWALEEPLAAGDIAGCREIGRASGIAVILDESCSRVEQLAELGAGCRWVVNVRVSKMGGLLRAREFCREAAERGLELIVGAHVGETSLLTRAALSLSAAFPANILAREGAFGLYLLERDICTAPIQFGARGQVADHPSFGRPGFGVELAPGMERSLKQQIYFVSSEIKLS